MSVQDTPTTPHNAPSAKTGIVKQALKIIRVAFMPLVVLGLGVGGFALMNKLKPEPETKEETVRAVPVTTALSIVRSVPLSVTTQGEVRPRSTINLTPQVGGKLAYLSPNFLAGARFKQGEVIARIESIDYDLKLTQANANIAQAQTVLTRELSEADIARKDWDDLGQGTPSPLTLRTPQLAEARANLAAAQAAFDTAKLAQSRTIIHAPFDGRVLERSVSVGEYVGANQTLGRIFATDIADITLPLTDQDLAVLGIGIGFSASRNTPAPLVALSANVSGALHTWQATLTRTSPNYDTKTRTLLAHAELKDPYGKGADHGTPLANGLYVKATIQGPTIENSIIIPRNALRGKDQVYVATADDHLSIRTVVVRSASKLQVVLSSGLEGGERVVTSPIRGASDGMKIQIADLSATKTSKAVTASPDASSDATEN